VTIGGGAATGVTVVNDTTLTATTPTGVAGVAAVVVTTAGGASAPASIYTFWASSPVTSVTPTSIDVMPEGEDSRVDITPASLSATWTATSSETWVTLYRTESLSGGTSGRTVTGTGGGNLTLRASANPSKVAGRSATVTIGGRTVTMTQAPAFTVTPTAWTVPTSGGTLPVVVSGPDNASARWSARYGAEFSTTDPGWINFAKGMQTGNKTLPVSAPALCSTTAREGVVTVAGQPVTVTQAPDPTRPYCLKVDRIVGAQVTLRWFWAGPAVDEFELSGGAVPGETLATFRTGQTAPSFTFTAPTGTFYVRVAAVVGGVPSPVSEDVRIVVNLPVAPSAPVRLLGHAQGAALTLHWTNTADGGAPTGIVLDVTGSLVDSFSLPMTETFQFPGVPAGTYTFAVRAANAAGSSAASNTVTLTFPGGGCSAPAVPEGPQAFAVGRQLTVRWDSPLSGTAPASYLLTASGEVNGSLPLVDRRISAQVPPGSYTFTVAAVNDCGTGPATAPVVVVVP
jgi:hypothetical protein